MDAITTVLFTCAGQRVDVVAAFQRAGAFTVAADMNPLAPALYQADLYVLPPPCFEPEYVPFLGTTIAEHDVSLVVPLTDIDVQPLVAGRADLDALLLLPDEQVVARTKDKYLAHLFFLERGIDSPPTWLPDELPGDLPFPVLVKSREGFGSRNIFRARDREELDFFLARTPMPSMVQAECLGAEYSIDVFCDLESRCLNAIPRTMIESKGGESIKGMTIRDPDLIQLGRHVAETLEIKGPATIQCFRTPDGRHEITDVNARFGGAFPLPLAAGGAYAELALALARGERPEPRLGHFRDGVVMTRFFGHFCLAAGDNGTLEPFSEELPEPIVSEE